MSDESRRKHNEKILQKMREGKPLNTVSPQSTWFPPRPLTKKPTRILRIQKNDKNNLIVFERKSK